MEKFTGNFDFEELMHGQIEALIQAERVRRAEILEKDPSLQEKMIRVYNEDEDLDITAVRQDFKPWCLHG